mmetsp:Transcript_21755/g.56478  ORF Transcript_21755/g.56478 Transcript_21755/m.56478 type:complete len:313 (-) Transcript_21755:262-1200(-)
MSENIYKLIEEGQKPKSSGKPAASSAPKQVSAHKHYNSSAMSSILAPVDGYRGELERKGIKPKNHAKENVERMREQAEANKLRKEAERIEGEIASVKKPTKYDKVEAKALHQDANFEGEKHDFVKAKSTRVETLSELAKKGQAPKPTHKDKVKPSVPKRGDSASSMGVGDDAGRKDYIRENAKAAHTAMPNRKGSQPKAMEKKATPTHHRGEVPEYLKHRKGEIAEEKMYIQQMAAEKEYPPGTRLLPEHERQDTLRILRESKKKAEDELRKMPLVVETFTLKEKKRQLENKLKEIEDAEKLFSQPKVYVEA